MVSHLNISFFRLNYNLDFYLNIFITQVRTSQKYILNNFVLLLNKTLLALLQSKSSDNASNQIYVIPPNVKAHIGNKFLFFF